LNKALFNRIRIQLNYIIL